MEKPAPLNFKYTLPEDGQVTVTLFNHGNRALRTLVASAARKAGEVVEHWDGLGDDGKPLPAGATPGAACTTSRSTTNFVLSAHNSGQPPYKTDDNTGGWGGDHGCPPRWLPSPEGMILTWNMSESGWGVIKTDFTGKKLWGIKHNATNVACDEKHLFVLGDAGYNNADSVKPFDLKDWRLVNWGNGKPALAPPPGGDKKTNVATAVAYRNGKVYVSWTARNLIGVYDAVSGNSLQTLPVTRAGTPGRAGRRRRAGNSQRQVLRAAQWYGPPVDYRTARYAARHCGGCERLDLRRQCRRAAADRRLCGGRQLPEHHRQNRRSPAGRPLRAKRHPRAGGIAVDPSGKLWVAETLDSPKRHSVWDTKTGRCGRNSSAAPPISPGRAWTRSTPMNSTATTCSGR